MSTPRPASAADFLPEGRLSLPKLRAAASTCRGCDLYRNATQTVFGKGAPRARLVLIGEQPGDQEDRQGDSFVGPAGRILASALERAGIARAEVYITNAVKHFKWTASGKRRLHAKPSAREIKACRPWLESELAVIKPRVAVCLGATAAQALLGRASRLSQHRGVFVKETGWAPWVLATIHPSAILRMPDDASRRQAMAEFTQDIALAGEKSRSDPGPRPATGLAVGVWDRASGSHGNLAGQ
jgi:uracil-DNA glycosylase